MKVKSDFILRQIAGKNVVLPIGMATVNFDGMMTLNNSGVMLWKTLEQGATRDELVDVLTKEYDVSNEEAGKDVDEFIAALQQTGCIEEQTSDGVTDREVCHIYQYKDEYVQERKNLFMNKKIVAVIAAVIIVVVFALGFSICGGKNTEPADSDEVVSIEESSSEAADASEVEDTADVEEEFIEVPSQGDELIAVEDVTTERDMAVFEESDSSETGETTSVEKENVGSVVTESGEIAGNEEGSAETAPVEPEIPAQPSGNTSCGCEYERYLAMSAADQEAYMESFSSVEAFIEWGKTAEIEHEKHVASVTVTGDVLDIGNYIGGDN